MNISTSPFKRLREATGFSKVYFYKNTGLSESALTFIEEGLYAQNPVRADQKLLELCTLRGVPFDQILNEEYGAGTIPAATTLWQVAVRKSQSALVTSAYADSRIHRDTAWSPIEDFARRAFGSKTMFCKALKFQVAAFYQFNTGHTVTLPKAMYAALSDAGLSQRNLEELVDEQAHWLAMRKTTAQVALVD